MHAAYCAQTAIVQHNSYLVKAISVRIDMAIKLNYIYCSNPVTELIKYPVERRCRFPLGSSNVHSIPSHSRTHTQRAAKDKVE